MPTTLSFQICTVQGLYWRVTSPLKPQSWICSCWGECGFSSTYLHNQHLIWQTTCGLNFLEKYKLAVYSLINIHYLYLTVLLSTPFPKGLNILCSVTLRIRHSTCTLILAMNWVFLTSGPDSCGLFDGKVGMWTLQVTQSSTTKPSSSMMAMEEFSRAIMPDSLRIAWSLIDVVRIWLCFSVGSTYCNICKLFDYPLTLYI